jgi:4-diphosphocytidyl-2-C-methyl-D-erythritol kinase
MNSPANAKFHDRQLSPGSEIVRLSPAKVNLYLKVLSRRPDGYHDLATLMQRISLYDEMTFRPGAAPGVSLRCPGANLPETSGNIVYRAAELFFRRLGSTGGVEITLKKAIPLAAGLGGGSSNAATTLMALNELAGFPFSRQVLTEMGAALGADVPFFILESTAWAFGIGDRLEVVSDPPHFHFLLVNPGFELSTRKVYESLNLRLTKEAIHYSIPRFFKCHDVIKGLHNDLETVSINLYPVLEEIKALLLVHGAAGALMSGSGPTVFGVFDNEDMAAKAEESLQGYRTWSLFRAHTI